MGYRCVQSAALILGSLLFLFLFHVPENGYIAFALTGSFLVSVAQDRRARRIFPIIAAGLIYWAMYACAARRVMPYEGMWLAYPGAFLGLAAIVVMSLRSFWMRPADAELKRQLSELVIVPVLCSVAALCVVIAIHITPRTYDYILYRFDLSLGSPSFVVGKWANAHVHWFAIAAGIYNALPLWATLTWSLLRGERGRERRASFIILGAIGFVLYLVCPAGGPANRFMGQFPNVAPDPISLPAGAAALAPSFPRNAMPSLHIAWVLLVAYCSLDWRWPLRVTAFLIPPLTLVAMLGSGQHWLIDAIVAAPLIPAVLAAPARSKPMPVRRTVTIAAGAVIILWLIALRSGIALQLADEARVVACAGTVVAAAALTVWLRVAVALDSRTAFDGAARNSVTAGAFDGVT